MYYKTCLHLVSSTSHRLPYFFSIFWLYFIDKSYKKDSTLFTTSEDDVSGTTTFVECGNFRICFSNKASMEMTIETNPEKETIQITQRAGLISRLMTCFKMNDNEQWFGGMQKFCN